MKLYSIKRLTATIILTFILWLFRAQTAFWKCGGYMCVPLAEPCIKKFELITRCCICYTNTHMIIDIITVIIIPIILIYTILTIIKNR